MPYSNNNNVTTGKIQKQRKLVIGKREREKGGKHPRSPRIAVAQSQDAGFFLAYLLAAFSDDVFPAFDE